MKKRKTDKDRIVEAGQALMDLNAFHAIVGICEGGCFHASSNTAVQRIIKICQSESQKRLKDHDAALSAMGRDTYGNKTSV